MTNEVSCRRRSPCAALASLSALIAATSAGATDFSWDEPAGGLFEAFINWTPLSLKPPVFGPPGPGEMATFALGNASYTVTFNQSHTNLRLRIGDDHVTFNLAGQTYALTDSNSPSLIIAGVGFVDDAQLTLTNGVLEGVFAQIAPTDFSSAAQLVVGSGAELYLQTQLSVGKRDHGSMIVQSGGHVACSTAILGHEVGISSIGTGSVLVTGSGSSWHVDSTLIVGAVGNSTVTVENGAALTGFPVTNPLSFDKLGSNPGVQGIVNVTGNGSRLEWGGSLHVGEFGVGILNVTAGASASPTNPVDAGVGGLTIASEAGSVGTVLVTGEGSMLGGGLTIIIGRFGHGTVDVLDGADAVASNVRIASSAGAVGNVTIDGIGSTLACTTDFTIGGGNTFLGGAGSLTVSNGAAVTHLGNNLPDIIVWDASSITLGDGSITAPALTNHGALAGHGTIAADVTSDGTIAPGSSAGALHIDGNLSLLAAGTLNVEIAGAAPGSEHDTITVTGNVALGGELNVTLLDRFAPQPGAQFTIIEATGGAITGAFAQATLSPGLEILYLADRVVVAAPIDCPADLVSSTTFQPPPDGQVDAADLAFLLGAWGSNPGSPADIVDNTTFAPPPDGVVDAADLAFMLGAWGACE